MGKMLVAALSCLPLLGCASAAVDRCLQTPVSSKVSSEAVETCETALQEDLARQDVFLQTMGLLRERARFAEIISWSKRVLSQNSKRPDALYQLAYALRKTGDCGQALKKYLAYAELNPEDPDPYFGMGLCYLDIHDREGAERSFNAYIKKEKRDSQHEWVEKARTHLSGLTGSVAGAPVVGASQPAAPAAALAAAPSAAAPSAPAAAAPATAAPAPALPVAPKAGPKPSASGAADCSVHERAIGSDPFATAAYDQWAECAAKAGRYADVIRRMRTALRDNPDWTRGLLHLARAYKASGDAGQAKAAFAKACTAGLSEACGQ